MLPNKNRNKGSHSIIQPDQSFRKFAVKPILNRNHQHQPSDLEAYREIKMMRPHLQSNLNKDTDNDNNYSDSDSIIDSSYKSFNRFVKENTLSSFINSLNLGWNTAPRRPSSDKPVPCSSVARPTFSGRGTFLVFVGGSVGGKLSRSVDVESVIATCTKTLPMLPRYFFFFFRLIHLK